MESPFSVDPFLGGECILLLQDHIALPSGVSGEVVSYLEVRL